MTRRWKKTCESSRIPPGIGGGRNQLAVAHDHSAAYLFGRRLRLRPLSGTSLATWSIVVVDTRTREVGVAAATCLTTFDLQAGLPMILVDVGTATAQSLVDLNAVNRIRIHNAMIAATAPNRILMELSVADPSYQNRQFGIVDARGRAVTFTGVGASPYDSGMTGQAGNLVYSIQGNVLTGAPVLTQARDALLELRPATPRKTHGRDGSRGGHGRRWEVFLWSKPDELRGAAGLL